MAWGAVRKANPACATAPDANLSGDGATSASNRPIIARVDRSDAIRLLQALVAAGANTRAPMGSDWVHEIALRDLSLQGANLASAIAYAKRERWLADSRKRKDWIYLTRTGEIIARAK